MSKSSVVLALLILCALAHLMFLHPSAQSQVVSPNIHIHPNATMQQHETSIAVHPLNAGIVLATAIAIDTAAAGRAHIGWYYTTNAGVTWMASDTLPTHTDHTQPMADPTAAINLNGHLFISGLYGLSSVRDFVLNRSTDGGEHWNRTDVPGPDQVDKPHIAVDVSASSPYRDYIYASYTGFDASTPDWLRFHRSTDGGLTFSSSVNISGTVSGTAYAFGTNLAVGAESTLCATWGGFSSNIVNTQTVLLGFNRSTNGGIAWSGATQILTYTNIGTLTKVPNTVRAPSIPCMDVDRSAGPRRGWIYVVYAARNPTIPDVFLIRSTDEGTSWSSPIIVNQDGSSRDQWQPWISVDPATGHLFVVYYDSRNFSANDSAQVYVSWSNDGGSTFQDILVSDVPFLPKAVRHPTVANYMGSYIGISALRDTVWPCWNDNRSGFHQAYASRIVFPPTSVREVSGDLPTTFALYQNYPNPFNPVTTIQFSLPQSEFVTLRIFNILGEEIAVLVEKRLSTGTHEVEWAGQGSPSGVYFYRLQAGSFVQTKKLLLLR